MARKKTAQSNPETEAPPTATRPTMSPERYYINSRDMTPEERFELLNDIFAEAFVEMRLAEIVSEME